MTLFDLPPKKKGTKSGKKGTTSAAPAGGTQIIATGLSPRMVPAKSTPTPKKKAAPMTKAKPPKARAKPPKPKAPACVLTIRDRGTFHFTRRADAHGNVSFCLQIGNAPSKATGLKLTFSATVTVGKKKAAGFG